MGSTVPGQPKRPRKASRAVPRPVPRPRPARGSAPAARAGRGRTPTRAGCTPTCVQCCRRRRRRRSRPVVDSSCPGAWAPSTTETIPRRRASAQSRVRETVAPSEVTWLQKSTRVRSVSSATTASTSSAGPVAGSGSAAARTTAPVTRLISSQRIRHGAVLVARRHDLVARAELERERDGVEGRRRVGDEPESVGIGVNERADFVRDRCPGDRRAGGRGRDARPRARAAGAPAPRTPAAARRRRSRG